MTTQMQFINLGSVPNDGNGDTLRVAMKKINDNFVYIENNLQDDTTVVNLGSTGEGLFYQESGSEIQLKKIAAGNNLTLTSDNEKIVISTTGTISANLAGNVTGVITGLAGSTINGNLTGNVVGNVTGNLTGNVTSSGTSTFNTLVTDTISASTRLSGTLYTNAIYAIDSGLITVLHETDFWSDVSIGNHLVVTNDISAQNINISNNISSNSITINDLTVTTSAGITGPVTVYDTVTSLQFVGPVTGDVTGNVYGNVYGNIVGDFRGSLFADDSSLLVDAVNNKFYGELEGTVSGTVTGDHHGNVKNTAGNVLVLDVDNSKLNGHVEGYLIGSVYGNLFGDLISNDGSSLLVDRNAEHFFGTVESISNHSVNDLNDVDTSSTPPTNGQALVWDNSTNLWKPGNVASGGGGNLDFGTFLSPSGFTLDLGTI